MTATVSDGAPMADVVFLIDCDNTLLDNDQVQQDLREHLLAQFGPALRDRYWVIFEELRERLGYVDYLGALQQLRVEHLNEPRLLHLGAWMMNYDFAGGLYPRALELVRHLSQWGPTVVLSDGDAVFQPRKIERAGLWQAVEGRVLIYVHKEDMLDDVARLYPARRYVMIDDKVRILAAMKAIWGERLTTVFPRQGHYAVAPDVADYAVPDMTVERVADLINQRWAGLSV